VNHGKNDWSGRLYAGRMRLQPNAAAPTALVNEVPLKHICAALSLTMELIAPYAAVERKLLRTYAHGTYAGLGNR